MKIMPFQSKLQTCACAIMLLTLGRKIDQCIEERDQYSKEMQHMYTYLWSVKRRDLVNIKISCKNIQFFLQNQQFAHTKYVQWYDTLAYMFRQPTAKFRKLHQY